MQPQNGPEHGEIPEQRLGVRQGARLREKNVGVEELPRIMPQRMRVPRHDPHIELRVGMIEVRESIRRFRDWVGGEQAESDEQGRDPTGLAVRIHECRRCRLDSSTMIERSFRHTPRECRA